MTRPDRTTDWTGLSVIKQFSHVKITHPRHSHYGSTGTVVRIAHPHVWVALPGGMTARAGHRSVEVL